MEENKTKVCSKCHIEKPLTEFWKHTRSKDGFQNWCKECKLKYNYNWNPKTKKHREIHICPEGTAFCIKCKQIKNINEFNKNSRNDSRGNVGHWCKQCIHEYNILNNPEPKINRRDDIKSGFKTCPRCKTKKPLKEFYKVSYRSIGYSCWCIKCSREIHREYANKPESKERKHKYGKEYNKRPQTKEYYRQYKKTSKSKFCNLRYKHKRRSRERNTECSLNLRQWERILEMQNNRCNECKREFNDDLIPTKDHIIPISSIWCPGLTFGNTQALCVSCNCSKNSKFYLGRAIDEVLVETWRI